MTKVSQLYKWFAKIILNRISSILDEHQSTTQAGFRSGFSTTDNIFVVEQIIEKCQEFNQPLFLAFIDYNKAFDSIEHPFLWTALKEQGIPHNYIRIMKNIYENSTAKIQLENLSRPFKIARGIKQGCCISPKSFNGALQKVFETIEWDNYGLDVNGEKLSELRFADDGLLIAQNKDELIEILEKVFRASKTAGLTVNLDKTKIMTNIQVAEFEIDRSKLEIVDEYKYLGKIISFKNADEKEVDARIAAGVAMFLEFENFFQRFHVDLSQKTINEHLCPAGPYLWICNMVTDRRIKRKAINCPKKNGTIHAKHPKKRSHKQQKDSKNNEDKGCTRSYPRIKMDMGRAHTKVQRRSMAEES